MNIPRRIFKLHREKDVDFPLIDVLQWFFGFREEWEVDSANVIYPEDPSIFMRKNKVRIMVACT